MRFSSAIRSSERSGEKPNASPRRVLDGLMSSNVSGEELNERDEVFEVGAVGGTAGG